MKGTLNGSWRRVPGSGCRSGFWVLGLGCLVLLGAIVSAQTPQRIISLIPAVTEMLFAIGAGDQVVGVSSFDTFPADVHTRPKVGGLFDPSFERILSLRPDLVITYGSQDELTHRLKATNIPWFSYRHGGLADITSTIRALGARTGHATRANALAAHIDAELDAVRAQVTGRPRPRTLLVFGREDGSMRGLFVSGGVGFLHDLLEVAGGDNVMADVPREGLQLSHEQLLVRAPDVVIELRGGEGWPPERLARELAVWRAVRVPASQSGRIHILADPSLVIPGPRVGHSARAIADALRKTVTHPLKQPAH
ncbi:MAG: helical backbone metal receptor [Acidobacteria bacterium]|nr:helical backbone metal receptor [Acidobacteriota bacterium]